MTKTKLGIAKQMRVRRVACGMTQAQLAAKAGVSVPTITAIEGGTAPLLETAVRIAEALGCTPNDLCGYGSDRGAA